MVGFKVDEIMVGTHRFTDHEDELPMHFTLTWGHERLCGYLNPFSEGFLCAEARGVITVGGLVHKADCTGILKLLYFKGRKIRYELEFADDKGRNYRYVGEKVNIWPWNLHRSHVTCYGVITELAQGKVISRSIVYFPLRELITFIRSARLVFSDAGPSGVASPAKGAPSGRGLQSPYRVLSRKDERIIAAMAGAVIPKGGKSFALGSADLEEKWLPRTDAMLTRMPVLTRIGLMCLIRILNYALPLFSFKGFVPLTSMNESERTGLFHIAERSGMPWTLSLLLVKILVFPAFYGLPEVKEAIGYQERFPNSAQPEGLNN